jgi:hypothetical protein
MEQYENARDRNILDAWLNGGQFEGKKVTDERIMKFYKMRRNQYTKDDPEYDYWDQKHTQIDYQIGESKMLLRYEQGGIKEGGAARWYQQNAKRFPKNSEAWREAMRNAARFKKAAQEARKAANTMSESEKYARAQDRIYQQRIRPAEKAIEAWEDALDSRGLSDEGNAFLTLGAGPMQGDEKMRAFMRSKKGRQFARAYERATGDKFNYKSFKRILRRAKQGYKQQGATAKRFGFLSYVPGFNQQAAGIGDYATQLNVFTDDIYDDYADLKAQYDSDMDEAENAVERQAVRDKYRGTFSRIGNRARKMGDQVLAGSIDNFQRAVDGKADEVVNRNELTEGKSGTSARATDTDIDFRKTRNEAGKVVGTSDLDMTGLGTVEQELHRALLDEEILAGFEDGSWIMVQAPDGSLVEQNVENFEAFYGFTPGASIRDMGFVQNDVTLANGTVVPVRVQVQPVKIIIPGLGELEQPGVFTYQTIHGETRYQFVGPEGRMLDTAALPIDWANNYDDGQARTPSGHWYDHTTNKIVPIANDANKDGHIIVNGSFAQMIVDDANAQWLATPESQGGTVPMTDAFLTSAFNARVQQVSPRTETGGYAAGGDITEEVQVANEEFREAQAPASIRHGRIPAAIDYVAGGRTRYNEMSDNEKARVSTLAVELSEQGGGGVLSADLQRVVNRREAEGYEYVDGRFLFQGEVITTQEATQDGVPEEAVSETGPQSGDIDPNWVRGLKGPVVQMLIDEGFYSTETGKVTGTAEDIHRVAAKWDQTYADRYAASDLTQYLETPEAAAAANEPQVGMTSAMVIPPREDAGYTPIPEMVTITITLPAVLTEAGSTLDTSGRLAQYQGPAGRETIARMTAEQRSALATEIAAADGQGENPAYIYDLASELDILAAAGDAGLSEAEFYRETGSLSDNEKYRGIQQRRHLVDVGSGEVARDLLNETLMGDLREAHWTDDQIRSAFPEQFEAEEADKLRRRQEQYGILPGDPIPGATVTTAPYAAIDTAAPTQAPKAAASELSEAVKNAQIAGGYVVGIPGTPSMAAAGSAPILPGSGLTLPTIKTTKPLTTLPKTQTTAPTATTPTAPAPTFNGGFQVPVAGEPYVPGGSGLTPSTPPPTTSRPYDY